MIFLGVGIVTYQIPLPFLNAHAARGYYAMIWFTILAFGVGTISHFAIERPMNRMIEKRRYI